MPIADVQANGSDDPLVVSASESVNVTLSFDPGGVLGEPGEYRGILLSSFGNLRLFGFQAELIELGEPSLFDARLPPGWYVFLFNVDSSVSWPVRSRGSGAETGFDIMMLLA